MIQQFEDAKACHRGSQLLAHGKADCENSQVAHLPFFSAFSFLLSTEMALNGKSGRKIDYIDSKFKIKGKEA